MTFMSERRKVKTTIHVDFFQKDTVVTDVDGKKSAEELLFLIREVFRREDVSGVTIRVGGVTRFCVSKADVEYLCREEVSSG